MFVLFLPVQRGGGADVSPPLRKEQTMYNICFDLKLQNERNFTTVIVIKAFRLERRTQNLELLTLEIITWTS